MKIALKYGLLVTLGVIVWIVTWHALIPMPPESKVHSFGAFFFFNLVEILAIYFGIKARRRESMGALMFKDGVKTGVSIALVYGISSCLFFLAELFALGPKLLAGKPGAETEPTWKVAAGAFAGLFLGAILFGLVYSIFLALFLRTRSALT